MTWIRLDTDFADHDLIGRMAEALRIDPDRAAMSLIRVWCRFADHQPDGNGWAITDTTLEDWAKWRGRRGQFAAAFRAHGLDDGGIVNGWWRQQKLLDHQQQKRRPESGKRFVYAFRRPTDGAIKIGVSRSPSKRLRELSDTGVALELLGFRPGDYQEERKIHAELASERIGGEWFHGSPTVHHWLNHWLSQGLDGGETSGNIAGNNNKNSNDNQLPVVGGTAEVAYLVRCVTALNRGLKANRRLEGFREVSSSEQQGRVTWEADGIPVELAAQVVEQVAEAYQPGPRSRQPNSLRYFDAAVRRAHEQAVQAATNPSQEPQEAAWLSR